MSRVVTIAVLLFATTPVLAQGPVPGQNVNMVSSDPYLQKQNEPSIAVMTNNPCHLVAGANDYRTVNIAGLPADKEIGDAWVGWYTSLDCGQTWDARLVPGYPQDTSPEGMASPVKGLSAAADPTVRAGVGGFVAYSFIAFNRGSNVGRFALARAIDDNNKEAGNPIRYIGTLAVDSGSAGQFLDKPYIAVVPNGGSCTLGGRTIPGSTVHMVWTVFVGNSSNEENIRTKVYYARSSNCGESLDGPATKLSEAWQINQGGTLAITPDGQTVYAIWRQFAYNTTPDQILIAKSVDGGRTFTKAAPIQTLSPLTPFEQGTSPWSFRTTAYPTAAFANGRLYVAVALRGFAASDQARIAVTSSTDGSDWTMPQAVENVPADPGHQIMPALTFAGGRLHFAWYDLRDDMAYKVFGAITPFITEAFPIRRTLDVRAAEGTFDAGGSLTWTSYGVLQFGPGANAPRVSRYLSGNYGGSPVLQQLQFNRPNLRLYAGGTAPFMGDFIDIAGLQYAPDANQQYVLNGGTIDGVPASAARTYHAVWTDNRDAKVPSGDGDLAYAAVGTASCTEQTSHLTLTRNANVYTARISPGLEVFAPGNAKSKINDVSNLRAFAVSAFNRTNQARTFRMTVLDQPTDGFATFDFAGTLTSVDVVIPRRSGIARSVFIKSAEKYARVRVEVTEINAPPGETPLTGGTILNPDIQNPDIQNPDIQNPDIQNPDIQNAEVHNPDIQNPDIQNPDIQNPDIQNPDIQNPDIQNPDIQNPDIQNPDIQNPDIQNPDIQNPDIQNPDIQNPDIQNPDIQNGSITDVSYDVTNTGNTTSSYQVKFSVDGNTNPFLFQIVGRRVYKTPTSSGCNLAQAGQNQILFNVANPDLTPGSLPDANAPDATNATVLIRPGETIKITLRAWDKDVLSGGLSGQDGDAATPFCPFIDILGANCTTVTNPITVTVTAQAPNTGALAPSSDTYGAPGTIYGVVPQTAAAGQGQLIAVFVNCAPAGTPTRAAFTQAGQTQDGFVFESPSKQGEYFVRLPIAQDGSPLLSPGPATVHLEFGAGSGMTSTGEAPLTVSATPSAPIARIALPVSSNGCDVSSLTPLTRAVPGGKIAVSAYGTDTVNARAVFTQGANAIEVQSLCSVSSSTIGLAAVFDVPLGLLPGGATVRLKTSVNGVESGLSNPLALIVDNVRLFAVDSGSDSLYTVDAGAPTASPIGALGAQFLTPIGMAVRPSDGTLFVWNNTDFTGPATVDKCTGAATPIGASQAVGGFSSLAFSPGGTLYALDVQLAAVDTTTGALTTIGSIRNAADQLDVLRIGAADFNAQGVLYGAELNATGPQRLATIDTASGQATVIGTLTPSVGTIGALVFTPGGTLLGSDIDGRLFDINPSTAEVTNVRVLPSGFAPQGLGFAPGCSPIVLR